MKPMFVLIAALVFGGCASVPNPITQQVGHWRVTHINGDAIPEAYQPTVNFSDRTALTGSSGCNRYRAPLVAETDRYNIGAALSTKMACPGEAQYVEQAFFSTLPELHFIDASERVLELSGDNNTSMRLEPLL
jgi:heat shock protein HslJ